MKTPKDFPFQPGKLVPFVRPESAQPTAEQLKNAALLLNIVFGELQVCFPAWQQAFPYQQNLNAAKELWLKEFVRRGISTHEQILWGLQQAREQKRPYWPSPGEFISWCHPDPIAYGLPSVAAAYAEACLLSRPGATHEAWSHAVVYAAACRTGFNLLNTQHTEVSQPVFERAYKVIVLRFLRDEPINQAPIPKGIPMLPQRNPEVAKPFLQIIKSMLSKRRDD